MSDDTKTLVDALDLARRQRDEADAALRATRSELHETRRQLGDAQRACDKLRAQLVAQRKSRVYTAPIPRGDAGFLECVQADEPQYVDVPAGWEWAGKWRPVGAGMSSEGNIRTRWRRNVRRVES